MKRLPLILLLAFALAVSALTSPWWGHPILQFIGARSELIQALESALQIVLWFGTAVTLAFGWRVSRKEADSASDSSGMSPGADLREPTMSAGHQIGQTGSGGLASGQGNVVGGAQSHVMGTVHNYFGASSQSSSRSSDSLVRQYLQWLIRDCAPLKLRAIDQAASKPGTQPLGLTSVYIDLNTDLRVGEKVSLAEHLASSQRSSAHALASGTLDPASVERMEGHGDETRLVPVLEVLGVHNRFVLLGAPGSGKSTFVSYVALSLAEAALEDSNTLDRLGPWWKFGPLLPIRIVLRQFGANIPKELERGRAKHLWEFLEKELDRVGLPRETASALRQASEQSGALFLFDGLDETRERSIRARVLESVTEFAGSAGKKCRFLITSRPYAWEELGEKKVTRLQPSSNESAGVLAELPFAYRLAELNPDQVQTFIIRWYEAVQAAGWLGAAEARDKAENLQEAVKRSDLMVLARNPLLLTLMATLHSNRGRLPDDRADLYDEAVELLLQRWNESIGADRGLLDALAIPSLKLSDLREVMQRLAFEAHVAHSGKEGLADIPEGDLHAALRPLLTDDVGKADLALKYIEERAGLLLGQGERGRQRQYTFPHRTFQEFLAACHLAGQHDFCQQAADLARENAAHWREVLVLAARHAKAGRGVPSAHALVRCQPVQTWLAGNDATDADWRAAAVAGGQLLEIGMAAIESRAEHRAVRDQVRDWLAAMLERGALEPVERAQVGAVLGRLNDPRKGTGLQPDGSPDIDWIEIPPGPFLMGEGAEQFTCDLITQPYLISRYPVTVSQFDVFVQTGGYDAREFWTENGWDCKEERRRPDVYDPVFQTLNHPQVGVSWYEAMAYCGWLSKRLELKISLPNEPEWERAARHTDGRRFPWGDETADVARRCNMEDTGIGCTSPVGIFPSGNAACGAADMAGNVWEWTRSLWGREWLKPDHDYPYRLDDARENLNAPPKVLRVLRGGAFYGGSDVVRCADRDWNDPRGRFNGLGFRVVASPFVSEG